MTRLAPFIQLHADAILAEWEAFARKIWPREESDPAELRAHAAEILKTTAADMQTEQTVAERSSKSRGNKDSTEQGRSLEHASNIHAIGRLHSGFDLLTVVSEYRALRASVIRLWRAQRPSPDNEDMADLVRFDESIDQSVAEAVRSYTEETERSRKLFLAILGHDLRSPLNAVTMSASTLQHLFALDDECKELATQISASSFVMANMIGNLLDFTLTSLGRALPLERERIRLRDVCKEVMDEMRAARTGAEIRFELHGDDSGRWDRDRLRQVLSNLLGNALQHGEPGEAVDLSVRGEASEVIVSVHNDGPPISPMELPTLFDPLVRGSLYDAGTTLSRSHSGRPGSIGLGLHIARQIALAHGGSLGAASTAQAGTIFTLKLPRAEKG